MRPIHGGVDGVDDEIHEERDDNFDRRDDDV